MRPINPRQIRKPRRIASGAPARALGATFPRGCLLLAIALSLAACDSRQPDDTAVAAGEATADATAAQAARPGGAPVDEVRSAANQAPGEEPTVVVSQTAPAHLVDASGNALYVLRDNQDGSKCDAVCESAWPPVVAHASRPTAAPGMPPGMLGALPREGGTLQMTYDGNPLYRYSGDMGQASTAGQGVSDKWGEWFLVGTDGALITQPVDDQAEGAAAQVPEGTGGEEPEEDDPDASQP